MGVSVDKFSPMPDDESSPLWTSRLRLKGPLIGVFGWWGDSGIPESVNHCRSARLPSIRSKPNHCANVA